MVRKSVRPTWIPLSLSALAHLALLLAVVALSRTPAQAVGTRTREAVPERHVEMIYVPPPPQPPDRPRSVPRPAAPPPARAQEQPEPEPNAPPEAVRAPGRVSEDPAAGEGETGGAARPSTQPPERQAATSTLESEARRIFGRPRLQTPPGAGPQAVRPMEAYLPDNPERCIPRPALPDTAGPVLGTVIGRIYRQDSGRPLAGAHLQMLGAPYIAFTDNNGEYRFRFDLSLVDNCRTQYVRVTAPGYESRLLVLMVGENIRSEDVRLRRR
jgi:hypothetical protein